LLGVPRPGTIVVRQDRNESPLEIAIVIVAPFQRTPRIAGRRQTFVAEPINILLALGDDNPVLLRCLQQFWKAIGKALRRIAPNLRQAGVDVRFDRGSGKGRRPLIVLEKLDILLSDLSEPSGDIRNRAASNVVSDRSDVSDSNIHPYSCESPCHTVNEARTHD
jgi:hypothetical protein